MRCARSPHSTSLPIRTPSARVYLAECARLRVSRCRRRGRASVARSYRVFGSSPGSYGAGILPLIDAGNWQTDADFAAAYVNWGGYAYTADDYGTDARAEFESVLGTGGGRGQEPGQPRARHLRLGRLPAVPRRHDRHHPRADGRRPAPLLW